MIELLIKRLSFSKKINQIIVAIPKNKKNNKLNNFLNKKNIMYLEEVRKMFLKDSLMPQNYIRLILWSELPEIVL